MPCMNISLGFRPKDKLNGLIYMYNILYGNVPIFGRWVHLGMVNNNATSTGSFQNLGIKNHFQIWTTSKHDRMLLKSYKHPLSLYGTEAVNTSKTNESSIGILKFLLRICMLTIWSSLALNKNNENLKMKPSSWCPLACTTICTEN